MFRSKISCAIKRLLILSGLLLSAFAVCQATDIAYSGIFQGSEGAANVIGQTQAKTYTRDVNTTGHNISFQVVYSTYIVASSTFSSDNYTLNTPTITLANNNFTMGLPVLYSTGTAAISGLTNQSTYYISIINPNTLGKSSTFKLSSTSTGAVAGVGIVLASSSTASNKYTLAPLAFTNSTGGMKLQFSDDNSTYFDAAVSSLTFTGAGGSALYDLGSVNHRYLRLKETPPLTGAVTYTAYDNERH